MKSLLNKKIVILSIPILLLTACEIEPVLDPNNPSESSIVNNASISEIQNVVTATESVMRESLGTYYDDVSVIGREYFRHSTSDPRFTSDLLGKANAVLDNNTFYITNPYASRYRAIKNANILIDALTNTTATISDAERKAGIAYAKTIQAYQYLLVLNLLHDNGIRFDVKNPDALGGFLTRPQALDAILNLLNTANADLKNVNVSLPFTTTLFDKKASEFSKFNRALAARVAVYKQDWAAAATALDESFLELNGNNLNKGAYHNFSTAGGDLLNPLFFTKNSVGEARITHPSFITDAESGDKRLAKAPQRDASTSQDGLSSNYDFFLYTVNDAPIPIIRNEELILLYAEVKAQQGATASSVSAINIIRNAAGLGNYTGATDKTGLISEILKQRRYSLFGEGHRWIDLRRYNLLSQLPIDRTGDDVWIQFPIPANEQ